MTAPRFILSVRVPVEVPAMYLLCRRHVASVSAQIFVVCVRTGVVRMLDRVRVVRPRLMVS